MNIFKLQYPIANFSWAKSISQLFGVNQQTYKDAFGIPGHNGLDIVGNYGDPVLAAHDGVVSSIILDTPDHTKGNGIYLMSKDGLFYTIYWHLSAFNCQVGDRIVAGQKIGEMGNSGFVFPQPTPENPHAGTHLHFAVNVPGRVNDYKSFVDPVPWLFRAGDRLPLLLNVNMFWGSRGDPVSWLQTLLELEGLLDAEPVAYFGPKTWRAVRNLQVRYGITPAWGYCGSKTERLLNQKYSAFWYEP